MFRCLKLLLCFGLYTNSWYLHAQDSLYTQINKAGYDCFAKNKLPGLLVATLKNGERQFFTWGYADVAGKQPFTWDTRFEAASITKTFTAFVLEKVLSQKNIADTVSILSFLPDTVQQNKTLRNITFLSLLNHTSGLPRLPGNFAPKNAAQPYADYSVAHLFSYLKTCVPKGDGTSNYSNTGAALAGVLAQRLSGKTFGELLQQYVYNPFAIRMNKRGTRIPKAVGYNNHQSVPWWQWDAFEPTGGLRCNAQQLLQYAAYMSKPGNKKEATFIQHFLQPTVRIHETLQVARGWHILKERNRPALYWHNGGTYGFSTFVAFAPGTGTAVVVVANRFGANAVADELGFNVLYKLLQ